jgi:hypothetical protein
MWVAGNCWLMLLSSFHVAAQGSVAGWVLARALSIYLLAFSGSMALGSAVWGALARASGRRGRSRPPAVGLVLTLPLLARFRLPALEGRDFSPTKFSPAPRFDLSYDRGPVMVTVRYEIADADRAAFTQLMRQMELVRRRSGAVGWALYEDPEQPNLMLEVSWSIRGSSTSASTSAGPATMRCCAIGFARFIAAASRPGSRTCSPSTSTSDATSQARRRQLADPTRRARGARPRDRHRTLRRSP